MKLLFLDVDGTLTDGKLYIGDDGEVFKAFNVKDGYAIHELLPKYNIIPIIITARTSKILEYRCKELGIKHLYQNCKEKRKKMVEIAQLFDLVTDANGIIRDTAYMGDDILDLQCMKIASVKGCPKDAIQEILQVCDFVSNFDGGNGAVREFIEWIVNRSECEN